VPSADLFNPARSARWTLESVNVLSSADCDGMELWATSGHVGIATEIQAAFIPDFRDAMLGNKFTTSIDENPGGTQAHAWLILAAAPGEGVEVYQDGDELVSLNLPLEQVGGPAYDAALDYDLSPDSQLVLATMIASSQGWAAASAGHASEAEALVTGAMSKADRFGQIVDTYLSLAGVPSRAVVKLHAHFRLFGQLPLIQANLSDCTVLIDPLTGNISGPFQLGSAIDGRGLLSFYPDAYEAGSGVRYFGGGDGCGQTTFANWTPMPAGVPGAWPRIPGTPVRPSPGRPLHSTWQCWDEVATQDCVCEVIEVFTPPAWTYPIPNVTVRTRCRYAGGCTGPGPALTPPATGPQPPPNTAPGQGAATCTSDMFQWW